MTTVLEGENVDLLERLPPARLLALLAGACAIGLGILLFVLQLGQGPRIGPMGMYGVTGVVMVLIVNLVFGGLLVVAHLGLARKEHDWALLTLAFSTVLLFLGGIAGAVAGILGLFSGGSVLVRELPWRRAA